MKRPPVMRLVSLFAVMLLLFVGIVVRLAFLQVHDQGQFVALGLVQRERTATLPAARGEIVDRNGIPLAMTMKARDIYVDPSFVTDPFEEAQTLSSLLGLPAEDLMVPLTAAGTFAYVARQVDVETARSVADLGLPGIDFLPVPVRSYPSGALAPQVLGYVGIDGNGLAGMEYQYDTALRGIAGTRTQEFSASGLAISTGTDVLKAPVPGVNLVSTIDRQMQYQVQVALQRTVDANGADGGTVVVMDPSTGDVYAMASYPWFDPNEFSTCASDPDPCRNRALTDTFEPGSVNKIITAAAALETGAVNVFQRFHVPEAMQVGPFTIHDSHEHPIETMTLGDIITQSSNIGSAMVATEVGNDPLAAAMDRFGYGKSTGTGFPGEAAGSVPAVWDEVIRATASYGQGVSVTPMQMAGVYATIANGGRWVQPRLVRGTQDAEDAFSPAPDAPGHQVVRPGTATMLARMLAEVVKDGTGVQAQIPGYQVAGKTGTSRKIDGYGNYVDRYMASFVGFLPAAAPQLVIAVSIDEPKTVYGGVAAAPLFSEIARYAIQRLGIPAAAALRPPPSVIKQP